MTKHKGTNDTGSPIYLIEVVTVRDSKRNMDGLSFSTVGTSYYTPAEAHAAYATAKADKPARGWVEIRIKRPGSKSFMALKAGE